MTSILYEMMVETLVEKTRVYAQKPWLKIPFKNSISWSAWVSEVLGSVYCWTSF